LFELFIDQSWVINRGDSIRLAGYKDQTGKVVCYAYTNETKGTKGWKFTSSLKGFRVTIGVFILLAIGTLATLIMPIVFGYFAYTFYKTFKSRKKDNEIFNQAYALVNR
jgi:hypothetical protein